MKDSAVTQQTRTVTNKRQNLAEENLNESGGGRNIPLRKISHRISEFGNRQHLGKLALFTMNSWRHCILHAEVQGILAARSFSG
jgi:hypothetical protein